ncbi:hypothetical protein ZWY2020_040189 [Hordeum vulgare]|nr:hypothetical protein ZWY2020_040189 [Hordeum vulgare]
MATRVASRLLRAARNASLASRVSAAAASRAAAMANRSARAAAAAARAARLGPGVIALLENCPTRSTKPRFCPYEYQSSAEYKRLPDDVKIPTEKDLESDEAAWALYEHRLKAHNKERDHADKARRFKIFRHNANEEHYWNIYLPPDPKEAAIFLQKRQEAELLLSTGQDLSNIDECHLPTELGPFSDGGDPFITETNKRLLKGIEEEEMSQQSSSLLREIPDPE